MQTATINLGFSIYNFFLNYDLNPFKVLICSVLIKNQDFCVPLFPNTVKGEVKLLNSVTTSSVSAPALHSPSPSTGCREGTWRDTWWWIILSLVITKSSNILFFENFWIFEIALICWLLNWLLGGLKNMSCFGNKFHFKTFWGILVW